MSPIEKMSHVFWMEKIQFQGLSLTWNHLTSSFFLYYLISKQLPLLHSYLTLDTLPEISFWAAPTIHTFFEFLYFLLPDTTFSWNRCWNPDFVIKIISNVFEKHWCPFSTSSHQSSDLIGVEPGHLYSLTTPRVIVLCSQG